MKSQVIYPGTFDPITFGHIDIIERSLKVFGNVIVAVAESQDKNPLFTVEERIEMIEHSVQGLTGVSVDSFPGLLVDYAKQKNVKNVIRGIRAISDFDYEFQMALTNRKICNDIELLFMLPDEKYSYVSSRAIKEICSLGGDVKAFVPEYVAGKLREAK